MQYPMKDFKANFFRTSCLCLFLLSKLSYKAKYLGINWKYCTQQFPGCWTLWSTIVQWDLNNSTFLWQCLVPFSWDRAKTNHVYSRCKESFRINQGFFSWNRCQLQQWGLSISILRFMARWDLWQVFTALFLELISYVNTKCLQCRFAKSKVSNKIFKFMLASKCKKLILNSMPLLNLHSKSLVILPFMHFEIYQAIFNNVNIMKYAIWLTKW